MKVALNITRLPDKSIEASLHVIDGEDFPTECIFDSATDYPSAVGYLLARKTVQSITASFQTQYEADRWAAQQLAALSKSLALYRGITRDVPIFYVL